MPLGMDLGFTDVWGGETEERRGLRPLGWGELCARLAAAQDLRRAVRMEGAAPPPGPVTGIASFHRSAAQMLLDVAPMPVEARSERHVNYFGSEIGKADSGKPEPVREPRRMIPSDCPTRREKP